MGKVLCEGCKKKCIGSALRVQDKHFHVDCFKCSMCSESLAHGGFFSKEGHYYCTKDYQKKFGTKCANCGDYVEGEVVTALGNTYHQKCFVCARCRQPFPSGEKVTFTGKECLCSRCIQIPVVTSQSPDGVLSTDELQCAGCKEMLKEGQALIALDKQWHIWCFSCTACGVVLHGEYMGKNGLPYCEKDYQKMFGVKCVHCDRFITGKVLQAGENHHFHPTCARCTKCGDPFGDGEEMYMQGGAIWHPRCGPKPETQENGPIKPKQETMTNGQQQYPMPPSPSLHDTHSLSSFGSFSKKFGRTSPGIFAEKDLLITDLSRVYTHSYLTEEPTQGYLRRPIDPRPPKSPQFHRPPEGTGRRPYTLKQLSNKQGMQVLVDSIQASAPRPRSPHMNNEEPIELAHYPGAQPPKDYEIPKIERDDFPAPPFPYTDAERRRRWSGSSKDADDMDQESDEEEVSPDDPQLRREEEELSKIATGIGKVFLKTVKEREKLRAWKRKHLDPRNASRTPSASKEPHLRLRYHNPVNASPSRDSDHPKPWEEDEIDQRSGYRSSMGRYAGTIPNYNMVSSLRSVPKPGYGLSIKSSGRDSSLGFTSSDLGCGKLEKTHSSEFGSGRSDISSISEQGILSNSVSGIFRSTPYSEGYRGMRYSSYSPHLRRSMPNVNLHLSNEPPKLYPYHLLVTANYRLPPDIDRCHLERHLSNEEFQALFSMSRLQFYRLPEWRRNELKRRCMLF